MAIPLKEPLFENYSSKDLGVLFFENLDRHRTLWFLNVTASCEITTEAKILNSFTSGEDTFMLYSYSALDEKTQQMKDHLFAWMTPYDEWHRAYGDHPKEWYDVLKEGFKFEIQYSKEDPVQHKIMNEDIRFNSVYIVAKTPS